MISWSQVSLLKVGHLAKDLTTSDVGVGRGPGSNRHCLLKWFGMDNNSIYPQERPALCTDTINPAIPTFHDEVQALCMQDLSADTRLGGGYDPWRPLYPDPSIARRIQIVVRMSSSISQIP